MRGAGARALVLAGAVVGACSGGADGGLEPVALDAAAIVDALRPSLVYVETPLATGSGFVVDGGYVITNAHVVDPFATATVTPVEGRSEDLDVVGSDVFADIAVLGPLDQDATAVALAPDADVEVGSEVFLVGFPGDEPGTPEPAIAAGIMSRQRQLDEFDLTFLQTDAAIGGGQSGGVMVDDRGNVVGVSGLSYAEEFALALASPDVARARDRILAGDAPSYRPLSEDALVQEATFALPFRYDAGVVVFPLDARDRTARLDVGSDAEVTLQGGDVFTGSTLINAAAHAEELAADSFLVPEDLPEVTEPVAPGTWELSLPYDSFGFAYVGAITDGASVTLTSDEPFVVVSGDPAPVPLSVGEAVTGILDMLEVSDSYVVELAEGDEIDVRAASPAGDMRFRVVPPDTWLGEAEEFDDSPGGLYGFDAEGRFRADTSGPHRIVVSAWDPIAVGYILETTAV